MKKIVNLTLFMALTVFVISTLSGCAVNSKSNELEGYEGYLWNDGDHSKHLRKFDPIMDEIPRDYLKYLNLNPDDYNIDTLEQWSTSNPGTGAAYHSFVYRKDQNADSGFYIWVLDDGRVNDTRFVEDLEPAVQKYIAKKIENKYPEVRVFTSLGYHYMPSKEWKESDGIENFLNSDDEYLLFVYVVYGDDVKMTEADVEAIKEDLAYLKDVTALFYRVDNPDIIEKTELPSMKEEFRFYIHK